MPSKCVCSNSKTWGVSSPEHLKQSTEWRLLILLLFITGCQERRICPEVLQIPRCSARSTSSSSWLKFISSVHFSTWFLKRCGFFYFFFKSLVELQPVDPDHRGHWNHPERDPGSRRAGLAFHLCLVWLLLHQATLAKKTKKKTFFFKNKNHTLPADLMLHTTLVSYITFISSSYLGIKSELIYFLSHLNMQMTRKLFKESTKRQIQMNQSFV